MPTTTGIEVASPATRSFPDLLAEAKARPRARVHGFHRWYGKLVPAIPAAAIEAFTERGDLVLDPFCGSGTSLVEARLAGRRAEGCDVNPLATLLSRVKTTDLPSEVLSEAAGRARARLASGPGPGWRDRLPGVPNREHFHPEPVARDLVALLAAADEEAGPVRDWFRALASAINRDVSNADTRHVFPGVSRRMREKIAAGWRADVPARWERALRDRLRANDELRERCAGAPAVRVHETPAERLSGAPGRAALVVTNPPYVSSIRWVETFKLEAWWLGLVRHRSELAALDERMLGSERGRGDEPPTEEELEACPARTCRPVVAGLTWRGEHAMARVVLGFVAGLDRALGRAARALRPGGHAVIKLAPSRVRGEIVPTPAACVELLERRGVALEAQLDDPYAAGSRSLTPARNWYSGRMDADRILIFGKRDR